MSSKPSVLILGGCGFIGRNLVHFLVTKDLASKIRVVDKNLPATSYLSEAIADDFKKVEYVQADLCREAMVQEKAFGKPKDKSEKEKEGEKPKEKKWEPEKFDFVINLCGETRFGLSDEEYKKKCLEPAVLAAKTALAAGVKRFVEISTAQIYAGDKKQADEDAKHDPWTTLAKYRLEAENELKKIKDLPLVILRPAIVYGSGDMTGITPRIVCAAVYQDRKEKMKFLWDKSLKLNTVHVSDVCKAIWEVCTNSKLKDGAVYNLADESDLDQGTLNGMLGEIFGIKVDFLGSMLSNLAKMQLSAVAEEANDKHVPGWTKLCQAKGIVHTPLSPYIDKELLHNNSLSVNGTKISKDLGFKYDYPKFEKDNLLAIVKGFIAQKIFPDVLEGAKESEKEKEK